MGTFVKTEDGYAGMPSVFKISIYFIGTISWISVAKDVDKVICLIDTIFYATIYYMEHFSESSVKTLCVGSVLLVVTAHVMNAYLCTFLVMWYFVLTYEIFSNYLFSFLRRYAALKCLRYFSKVPDTAYITMHIVIIAMRYISRFRKKGVDDIFLFCSIAIALTSSVNELYTTKYAVFMYLLTHFWITIKSHSYPELDPNYKVPFWVAFKKSVLQVADHLDVIFGHK